MSGPNMRPFRIRDPIHGFVELRHATERLAIDTPRFQRLRGIRQLAMTHLVYPGTLHTRFEHSMGVCHIAGRLAAELEEAFDEEQVTIVRAAALLHDIGHGPFSHVSENVLDDRNKIRGVHEAISVAIVRTDTELHAALGKDVCLQAADLIAHEGAYEVRSALRDIVTGPSDADKLDYLLRDSYFAGVSYGTYDLQRLIDTVDVINPGGAESYLGFKADGLWAVEGLLVARHHMFRQVYSHKTRVATDILVERALSLGIEDGAVDPEAFDVPRDGAGAAAPDEAFLERYLALDDASVMHALLGQEHATPSRDLAERLVQRRLVRRNARISLNDARQQLGGPRIGRILDHEASAPKFKELEEAIAGEVCCPGYLVALRFEESNNPVSRTPNPGIGDKDVMLSFDHREPETINAISEIFRDDIGPDDASVSLYFPKSDTITDNRARELLWNALKSI
jgi:HD superfamily phosphohydrolase